VSAIRSLRGEMNIAPGKCIVVAIACGDGIQEELEGELALLISLARLERVDWLPAGAEMKAAAVAPLLDSTVFMPLAGVVDVEAELVRLAKEKARLEKEIAKNRGKLANAGFLGKAPPEIVAKVESDLRSALTKSGELEAAEMRLRGL